MKIVLTGNCIYTCSREVGDLAVIKLVALGIGFLRTVATGGARYYDGRLCRNIIFTSVGQFFNAKYIQLL